MSKFEKQAFLDWLDEQDGYSIRDDLVREKWPSFYEHHNLIGVTMTMDDDGNTMVPKRDYRDAVIYGYARD